MKAIPMRVSNNRWRQCEINDATHIKMYFPLEFKPLQIRLIPIQLSGSRHSTNNWSWNGDTEKPTLRPSILTQFNWGQEQEEYRCHSFVNDGVIQFLSDCSHDKANTSIELMDVK